MSRPGIVGMLDRKRGRGELTTTSSLGRTVSFQVEGKQDEVPYGSVRFVSQAASLIRTTLLGPIEIVTTYPDRYAIC